MKRHWLTVQPGSCPFVADYVDDTVLVVAIGIEGAGRTGIAVGRRYVVADSEENVELVHSSLAHWVPHSIDNFVLAPPWNCNVGRQEPDWSGGWAAAKEIV